jgi:hypothetical protein
MTSRTTICLLGFLVLTGCGSTPQEELLKKWMAHLDESRNILARVSDEASAKTALAALNQSVEAFEQTVTKHKQDAGSKIAKEEDQRLASKYGEEFEKLGNRFRGESERIKGRHPEAWQILEPAIRKVKGVKSPAERVLGR